MKAEERRKNTLAVLIAAGAALTTVTASGCKPKTGAADVKAGGPGGAASTADNAPTPVNVAPATEQVVSKLVPVTGSIAALQTVSLTPKVTANVVSVAGREGDTVRAGQVVVQQDTTDLQSQLQQSQANLLSARAKLTQARTQYNLQTTTSSTTVQNARAALAAAQANLALAKQPQRSEDIRRSDIAVQQAQANYDKAVADRKRYDFLVKEGAAAQSSLEDYLTQEKVQSAALESAKQNAVISQTGGRAESISSAQAAVAQARIALQQAIANIGQNAVRQDDIRAAAAAVAQNEALVSFQKQQLADASIRAPIDGIISVRSTEPGALAAPGASVMQIVALGTVYYQAQVPETDIAAVQRGRTVQVKVDAFPGRSFTGQVGDLYPTASTTSRNFSVRISIPNAGRLLRPGMYARGNVVVLNRRGIVVPKDAIVGNGDGSQQAVFVAQDGKMAARRPVKIGIQTSTTSEILSGVAAGDEVIVAGQDGLKDGSPIHVERLPEGATAQEASAR